MLHREGNATYSANLARSDWAASQPVGPVLALVCIQSIHTTDSERQSSRRYALVAGCDHVCRDILVERMEADPRSPEHRHRAQWYLTRNVEHWRHQSSNSDTNHRTAELLCLVIHQKRG